MNFKTKEIFSSLCDRVCVLDVQVAREHSAALFKQASLNHLAQVSWLSVCVCVCSVSSQRRFRDGVGGALRANQRTAAGAHARRPYRRRTERAASAGVARVLVSRSNCVQRSLRHSLQYRARVHVGAVGTVVACARQQAGGRQRPVAARVLPFVLLALEFVRLVARAPLNCQECR